MKVLVLDNVSEKAVAILKENGIEADVSPTSPWKSSVRRSRSTKG